MKFSAVELDKQAIGYGNSYKNQLSLIRLLIIKWVFAFIMILSPQLVLAEYSCPLLFQRGEVYSESSIRFTIFNVQKTENVRWKQELFDKLVEQSDITLIQEAVDVMSYSSVKHKISFYDSWKSENFETGLATLSRVQPMLSMKLVSPTAEPISNTPKVSSIEQYSVAGQAESLLVVNTHGINFRPLVDFKMQIDEIFAAIKNHKGPMLWAGDFNTWSPGRKKYLMQIAKKLSLTEVVFENRKEFLLILDHAFIRGMNIRSAQQLDVEISDHRPLELVLDFI